MTAFYVSHSHLTHKLLVSYADQNVVTYNIGNIINANTTYYLSLLQCINTILYKCISTAQTRMDFLLPMHTKRISYFPVLGAECSNGCIGDIVSMQCIVC